jgi:hypothetical protein
MGWTDADQRAYDERRRYEAARQQERARQEAQDAADRRRDQEERDRAARLRDMALREQRDREERERLDRLAAQEARDRLDRIASEKNSALWEKSDQHKQDLRDNADSLKADLWARRDRERAEQNAAMDALIAKRQQYHSAREIVASEKARRQQAASRARQSDPFVDMAVSGMAMIGDLFFGVSSSEAADGASKQQAVSSFEGAGGAGSQRPFRLSDLSDADLEIALSHFDVKPLQLIDGASEDALRLLEEEEQKKQEEQARIRQEKWQQLKREEEEGRKFGLHEQWNWRIGIRPGDVAYWQNAMLAFPSLAWARKGEASTNWNDRWSQEFLLDAGTDAPELIRGIPGAWSQIIEGFRTQSGLFDADGHLRKEVCSKLANIVESEEDLLAPSIRFRDDGVCLDVIGLLRSGTDELIAFNLENPSAERNLTAAQLSDMAADGSLYEWTFERCKELAQPSEVFAKRAGEILGHEMFFAIVEPFDADEPLPLPGWVSDPTAAYSAANRGYGSKM